MEIGKLYDLYNRTLLTEERAKINYEMAKECTVLARAMLTEAEREARAAMTRAQKKWGVEPGKVVIDGEAVDHTKSPQRGLLTRD